MRIACPHPSPCCGNALVDLEVKDALGLKHDRVAAALARVPTLAEMPAIEVSPCLAAPAATAYRNTITFAVAPAPAGDPPRSLIGVRDGKSRVTDLPQCKVIARPLARRLDELRSRITPGLREVTLRVGTGQDPEAQIHLTTDKGRRMMGAELLPIDVGGLPFRLGAQTPMPPNLAQVEREAGLAADWLAGAATPSPAEAGDAGPLLAVHAGAGLHALLVARALGVPALLLESHATSIDDARDVIEAASLPAEARLADPTEELPRLARAETRFCGVLVELPAGRALAAEALAALAALTAGSGPGRAAILGTEPERLAATLGQLRPLGLRAVRVVPVDAEPGTDRVHAVALLERADRPWEPPRLYEDDAVIALAKPGGIASTGADSLDTLLVAAAGGERTLWPVHRLDAGTSGVLLFARSKEAARALGDAFAAGTVDRRYVVLAAGPMGADGAIDDPLPEPGEPDKVLPARTRWKRQRAIGPHTLLSVEVETGRTHQIRRHFAGIRHPVVGDGRYGDPGHNRTALEVAALDRPFVHAAALRFISPATGQPVTVEAPLPADLTYALARLERAANAPG